MVEVKRERQHRGVCYGLVPWTVLFSVAYFVLLDPFGIVYPKHFPKDNDDNDGPLLPPKYKTSWGPSEDADVVNVHLIPHTHDDAGWQVSVDEYQMSQVDVILDNVFVQLEQNPDRRFTYAETNFFAAWFRRQDPAVQRKVRKLVAEGRLEFVNGGWVQHDEAGPLFNEMIDQTTRGHLWLKKHLGITPSVAWQLDPFGHSNTQAWLMSHKTGMDSIFFGRSDYRELNMRYANGSLEYIWEGSKTFGAQSRVFAVQLYGQGKYGGYYSWYPFEETNARDRNYVQDDPTMQDYNVKEWVDRIVAAAKHQATQTKTNHQMWMLGNDFTFQSASRWYSNYDKLIHYVNKDGRVRIFYSTPTNYVKAKHFYGASNWGLRKDDMFPLADGPHEYWTGYFTSRPSLKRQYRYASSFLTAARQIETLQRWTYPNAKIPPMSNDTLRTPTSPLGLGWTDDLEGAVAVVAHHDGVSGTARQSVTNDYSYRLSLGAARAEYAALQALQNIVGIQPGGEAAFCNCNSGGPRDCMRNMSTCSFTSTRGAFTVVVWNPLGNPANVLIEIPVVGTKYTVHKENDTASTIDGAAFVEIDQLTKSLPLMYLNDYEMSPIDVWRNLSDLENKATHKLIFPATVPSLGFSVFRVNPASSSSHTEQENSEANNDPETISLEKSPVENHVYRLDLHPLTKRITGITNKRTGHRFPFEIEWGYYRSSIGGCTKEKPDLDACLSQSSGAYLFRPNTTDLFWKSSKPIHSTVRRLGKLGFEIVQHYSTWISQTVRLDSATDAIQIEWTVGPIPIEDNWGKEIVVRYKLPQMATKGVFETDSNGREMMRRIRDERSGDFCDQSKYAECKKSLAYEPSSSNYYPVNAYITVGDSTNEMTVVVDATQGGTSLEDGTIELMTHRRVLHDDFRGVEEPLNETMCGCGDINAPPGQMGAHGHLGDGGCNCVGLAVRGKHYLILDERSASRKTRRLLGNAVTNPVQLAFFRNGQSPSRQRRNLDQSSILKPGFVLPENVHLLTLCSNYENGTLVRFSHSFEKDEHPSLSLEVKLDIKTMFANKIKSIAEFSLSANQPIDHLSEQQRQRVWRSFADAAEDEMKRPSKILRNSLSSSSRKFDHEDDSVFVLKPMDVRTFWIQFEEKKT